MAAETAAHGPSAGEYIQHHLHHLRDHVTGTADDYRVTDAQAQAGDTRQGLVQRSGWQVPADGLGGLSGCLSGLGAAWCRLGRLRMGAGKRGQRADHGDGQEHGRRALQAVFAVRRRRGMGEIVKEGHGVRCPVVAVKCLVSLAMCNEPLKTPHIADLFAGALKTSDKSKAGKFERVDPIDAAIALSVRYIGDRRLPDKAIDLVDEAAAIRPGSVIADLKIARGLDYYTGSVYETFLDGAASLGSICSGGRYDNLASQGNRKYPGVGLSIGLSRLVSYMLHTAGAHANRVSPAAVLVAVWNEEDRPAANRIANQLRARGIATDVAPTAAKLGKQIKYADKLGIPYVWFPATAAEGAEGAEPAGDEVKNIVTGEQVAADCTSWEPDTVVAQQTVEI